MTLNGENDGDGVGMGITLTCVGWGQFHWNRVGMGLYVHPRVNLYFIQHTCPSRIVAFLLLP